MQMWIGAWPIVDPDLPDGDKWRILGSGIFAGHGAYRIASKWESTQFNAFVAMALEALVMFLIFIASAAFGAMAALITFVLLAAVFVLSVRAVVVRVRTRSPHWIFGTYRNKVVMESDLDPEAHALLARARNAIAHVYASEVNRRGLLDEVANNIILPRQQWEIASLLKRQTELRHEQMAARQGVVTPELEAVLNPQQQALERSSRLLVDRVERLAEYAHRVMEADSALRAQEMLRNNDKYQNLLAHTDDRQGMEDLSEHAGMRESALRRTIGLAIQSGQTLAIPD